QEDLKEKPDRQQMAEAIVEGVDQLNRLVANILNYTRPFQVELQKIDLVALVQELRPFIEADKAWHPGLVVEIGALLPHISCLADPQLLKSALLNLAVNGLQAMPGEGKLEIEVGGGEEEVWIRVTDNG